jgi:RND family efflux transporter MFP subunit
MSRTRTVSLVSLALGTVLAGCAPPEQDMTPPPPVVTVGTPEEREVTDYSYFTGRIGAVDTIQVRARVAGYLDRVRFKEGDLVKEKDILFEIDPRVYQTTFDQAEANVAQAQARVDRLQRDHDRARLLVNQGAMGREDYEKYRGDLQEARAALNSARAALASARLNLDFTHVEAKVSGRLSRRMVDPGNLVKADDTVLTTIVTQDPMYAWFDVDDLTFRQIGPLVRAVREGKSKPDTLPSVMLGLAGEKGHPHQGAIDFVDNAVDATTGTMRMRGVFRNPDGVLAPGLFCRVQVPMGRRHRAILLTDRAVDTDQGQKVVYVVSAENVVERRPVELGGLHEGLREIESGLRPGERVVVDGIQRVRGGMTVVVK